MSAKTIVLITGANAGLGLEIVRALAKSSIAYDIFLGSRSASKAEEAINTVKTEVPNTTSEFRSVQVDIADDASIEAAFKVVEQTAGKVDVLVRSLSCGSPT